MSTLRTTPKHEDLIYDVGLNCGQDTDFYLKKGYRVVAFEAEPRNVELCRERFADAIADGRLIIVEGAITETPLARGGDRTARFFRNEGHSPWGSTSEEWAQRNTIFGTEMEAIEVKAVDFAEAMAEHGVPHYLKADIVGPEVICLRAMLDFENKPDYLSIRSEKLIFAKLEYEFDLLEELGYTSFKAVKQDFERIRETLPYQLDLYEFEDGASGPFGEHTLGRWAAREAVLRDYRRVFIKYWLFGDYSYMIQTAKGRKFISTLERIFRRSIPGWYDTHARHISLDQK